MAPKLRVLEISTPLWHLVKLWGQLNVKGALNVLLCLEGSRHPLLETGLRLSFWQHEPICIFNFVFVSTVFCFWCCCCCLFVVVFFCRKIFFYLFIYLFIFFIFLFFLDLFIYLSFFYFIFFVFCFLIFLIGSDGPA